jgi:hypothetical protein
VLANETPGRLVRRVAPGTPIPDVSGHLGPENQRVVHAEAFEQRVA